MAGRIWCFMLVFVLDNFVARLTSGRFPPAGTGSSLENCESFAGRLKTRQRYSRNAGTAWLSLLGPAYWFLPAGGNRPCDCFDLTWVDNDVFDF